MANSDLQAEATAAMKMVFDHFKRDNQVTFYKKASEVVMSNAANYNADYYNPYVTSIVKTASTSEAFDCIVIFPPFQDLGLFVKGDTDVKLTIPRGIAKIRIESEGYLYLRDATAIFIEGEKYVVLQDFRPLGMLGTLEYWEVVLKKDA